MPGASRGKFIAVAQDLDRVNKVGSWYIKGGFVGQTVMSAQPGIKVTVSLGDNVLAPKANLSDSFAVGDYAYAKHGELEVYSTQVPGSSLVGVCSTNSPSGNSAALRINVKGPLPGGSGGTQADWDATTGDAEILNKPHVLTQKINRYWVPRGGLSTDPANVPSSFIWLTATKARVAQNNLDPTTIKFVQLNGVSSAPDLVSNGPDVGIDLKSIRAGGNIFWLKQDGLPAGFWYGEIKSDPTYNASGNYYEFAVSVDKHIGDVDAGYNYNVMIGPQPMQIDAGYIASPIRMSQLDGLQTGGKISESALVDTSPVFATDSTGFVKTVELQNIAAFIARDYPKGLDITEFEALVSGVMFGRGPNITRDFDESNLSETTGHAFVSTDNVHTFGVTNILAINKDSDATALESIEAGDYFYIEAGDARLLAKVAGTKAAINGTDWEIWFGSDIYSRNLDAYGQVNNTTGGRIYFTGPVSADSVSASEKFMVYQNSDFKTVTVSQMDEISQPYAFSRLSLQGYKYFRQNSVHADRNDPGSVLRLNTGQLQINPKPGDQGKLSSTVFSAGHVVQVYVSPTQVQSYYVSSSATDSISGLQYFNFSLTTGYELIGSEPTDNTTVELKGNSPYVPFSDLTQTVTSRKFEVPSGAAIQAALAPNLLASNTSLGDTFTDMASSLSDDSVLEISVQGTVGSDIQCNTVRFRFADIPTSAMWIALKGGSTGTRIDIKRVPSGSKLQAKRSGSVTSAKIWVWEI